MLSPRCTACFWILTKFKKVKRDIWSLGSRGPTPLVSAKQTPCCSTEISMRLAMPSGAFSLNTNSALNMTVRAIRFLSSKKTLPIMIHLKSLSFASYRFTFFTCITRNPTRIYRSEIRNWKKLMSICLCGKITCLIWKRLSSHLRMIGKSKRIVFLKSVSRSQPKKKTSATPILKES